MPHKNKNAPLFLLSCVIHQANQYLLVGKPEPLPTIKNLEFTLSHLPLHWLHIDWQPKLEE